MLFVATTALLFQRCLRCSIYFVVNEKVKVFRGPSVPAPRSHTADCSLVRFGPTKLSRTLSKPVDVTLALARLPQVHYLFEDVHPHL